MLDYKSIIIKRYALGLSYKELAEEFSASKSGINDFIRAFERCEKLSYPLPEGITNYAEYSCAGVPLFRRNGYRQSGGRKPLFRNRDTALT